MKAKTFLIILSMCALGFMGLLLLAFWPKHELGFTDSFEKKPILLPIGVKAFPNKGDFNYYISFPGHPPGNFTLTIWGRLDKNKIENFIKSNDLYVIPGWGDGDFFLPAVLKTGIKKIKLRGDVSRIKGHVMNGRADVEIFVQEDNGKFFGEIRLNTRHG